MGWSNNWGGGGPAWSISEASARYDQARAAYRAKAAADAERRQEELIRSQSRTNCYTSDQCSSGFICAGGRCVPGSDSTGSTADTPEGDGFTFGSPGTFGCGMGPSNPVWGSATGTNDAGDGGGCNSNSSGSGGSGGGFSYSFSSCNTAGAGVCSIHPGWGAPSNAGDSDGGGGGGDCGSRCCTCTTAGCSCSPGVCDDSREKGCSYFCDEGRKIGLSLCSDEESYCGECESCIDKKCERRNTDTCNCDSPCSGCDVCSFSGECLAKACPSPPRPPKDPDSNKNRGCQGWFPYYNGSLVTESTASCVEGNDCGFYAGHAISQYHSCWPGPSCSSRACAGGHNGLKDNCWEVCTLAYWSDSIGFVEGCGPTIQILHHSSMGPCGSAPSVIDLSPNDRDGEDESDPPEPPLEEADLDLPTRPDPWSG